MKRIDPTVDQNERLKDKEEIDVATVVSEVPTLGPRAADTHKGSFGRVLVVAGSRGMTGAAILAGMGALRGGAGLVQVATTLEALPIVAGFNPCYLTAGLPQDSDGRLSLAAHESLRSLLAKADVLAIGPGLGQTNDLRNLLRDLLIHAAVPVVIDADALNMLSGMLPLAGWAPRDRRWVLTPHPGECARLCHVTTIDVKERREALAERFARDHGVVLVVKGHQTLVTDGERLYRNATGNPGMATGGTGDVLTGMIAALLAQGLAPFDAARLGAHWHGSAGDRAAARLGQAALIATDLLDHLGPEKLA